MILFQSFFYVQINVHFMRLLLEFSIGILAFLLAIQNQIPSLIFDKVLSK